MNSNQQYLILVDREDKPLGQIEKLEAHRLGLLHRAFSVFVFNTRGELLLQQRADEKYHSAGLWTNTCCSHPSFGEEINDAVHRRLIEEMGLHLVPEFSFSFIYKASFSNGLTEHELDHIFFCISDDLPQPDASEVKDWKYMDLDALALHLKQHPEMYTAWLKICFHEMRKNLVIFKSNQNIIQ